MRRYGYIDAHGIQQLAQNGIDAGALGAQTDGLAFQVAPGLDAAAGESERGEGHLIHGGDNTGLDHLLAAGPFGYAFIGFQGGGSAAHAELALAGLDEGSIGGSAAGGFGSNGILATEYGVHNGAPAGAYYIEGAAGSGAAGTKGLQLGGIGIVAVSAAANTGKNQCAGQQQAEENFEFLHDLLSFPFLSAILYTVEEGRSIPFCRLSANSLFLH